MAKMNVSTILVVVVLLLTVVNLAVTFNLYSKIKDLSTLAPSDNGNGNLVAPDNGAGAPTLQIGTDNNPILGSKDAKVTIVEFSDFQCPYCGRFYSESLPQIEENYVKTGKVKIVFRHFPLSFHPYAQKASEATECANEQGKFWEYHNKLFENQGALTITDLKQYATDLGLDATKFNACLDSGKMASEVQKDFNAGQQYGVSGTPAFFVNGVSIVGAQPYAAFQQLIEQQLAAVQ